MKKLVDEKFIEIGFYKDCDSNKLLIAVNHKFKFLLKQISFNKWMWIDLFSSGSLGEADGKSYPNKLIAIQKMIDKGYEVFEINNWEEYCYYFKQE